MFIDSHCHLDLLCEANDRAVLDDYLNLARSRGVNGFLCIGVELERLPGVLSIAESHDDVLATVGVHPLYAESVEPEVERLMTLADHPSVVGIGETGLDYFYDKADPALQQRRFIKHIEAARALNKPLVIHTRDARADTLKLLREHGASRGVLHCFTEDIATAEAAMELGFYISFSGIITFASAKALREVVAAVPLERLLIETDSPWLAPVPHRGQKNQPAFVVEVAMQIAQIRNVPVDEVGRITSANFRSLFLPHEQHSAAFY